jgi:hypothetical protein
LSTEPPVVNFETGFFELRGKTNIPTREFNTDSIYITVDSLTKLHFKKNDIKYSPKTKQFTVTTKIDTTLISTKLPPNKDPKQTQKQQRTQKPILVLGKGFATSIYGDSSKLQKINFPPQQTIATGLLRLEIETNEKNYIIELLNPTNEVIDVIENKKKHTFERLNGEYKIRITSDTNANHKWDPGNILIREEPEKTFFYRGRDKKYLIPIRENWEVDIKIKF